MHRQRDVGHDRLRARGGDLDEVPRLLDQFVAHVIERRFLRGRDHFLIGERGERDRVPVHHPPSAIDQPLSVKIDKGALHRARVIGVHRETLPRPIAGAAKPLQLLDNDAAVFFLPFPDAAEKFLAPEVVSRFAFFLARLSVRPRFGWRCRRDRCPAARALPCPACAHAGRGCPGSCYSGRGRG